MNPTRHRRHTASACAAVAVMGMLLVGAPAHGTGAATRTAVPEMVASEVEAALVAAETTAAASSRRALDADAAALRARMDADAAAARASAVTTQSTEANEQLAERTARVGGIAAALYRSTSSAPLLARVLTSADPETLLSRLGTMERLAEASASLAGSARAAANATTSQREQATIAQAEYERLATEAEAAAAIAAADAAAESLSVSSARTELDALYDRLAALTRTTAAQAKADRLERAVAQQSASQPGASGGESRGGGGPSGGTGGGSDTGTGGTGTGGGSTPTAPPVTEPPAPTPSTPPPPVPGTTIATPAQAQAIARSALGARGWGDDHFSCLVRLWNRESGWRVQARNPSSGAYGIPQAYPAEKLASAGPDWRTSAATQIAWGLSYIGQRYGSPCAAWEHSERTGWY